MRTAWLSLAERMNSNSGHQSQFLHVHIPVLDGVGDHLSSILQLQLRQETGDVGLDRFFTDEQTFSDLTICAPECHFAEYLHFAR